MKRTRIWCCGLDYYTDTVFEWVTQSLGLQGTVSAGGRYDGLVSMLGGREATPGVGCAVGCERVIELLKLVDASRTIPPQIYLILAGKEAEAAGLLLAEKIRTELPTVTVLSDLAGGSFKNQFKKADKKGRAPCFDFR